MSDDARQLMLLRHAKAEHTIGVGDHERRLIARGRRDAAEVGAWLLAHKLEPELVICSTAIRTRQTWDAIDHVGVAATEVEYARGVYSAGAAGVLNLIHEADPAVRSILVVGHEPTMSILAERLSEGRGDAEALAELEAGFPTSGIAVLRYAGQWADVDAGGASLEHFFVGRG
ncbi:MAG TPA: histidine phosphatase family protein [Dermatophilaceae bacterium]|jgi:phosphohistidine phosphatase|nr:histidine phosphatase family protein [Dermatophilaceae bacterium]